MDSRSAAPASQVSEIDVRRDDSRELSPADVLRTLTATANRRPRRSSLGRPLGVQIRDNLPLFRVR